jgi:hypothetical protein
MSKRFGASRGLVGKAAADRRGKEFAMWWKLLLGLLATAAVIVAGALGFGAYRWAHGTADLQARLATARLPMVPARYDLRELEGLPPPVQRYFRAVLSEGQPMVTGVRLSQAGEFDMGEGQAQWRAFTARQVVITRKPGFDWDARIALAPGIRVFVHDALVDGQGLLRAEALGLIPVVEIRGTPEAAQGELMRFLAEAVWYPTALLPSQEVRWEALGEASARATLAMEGARVSLDFHFDADGLISHVRAAGRFRTVGGALVPTAWQVRVWGYALRDGLRIPLEGEAAWELPEGLRPYWRGRLTAIAYVFAR